jgi:type I restriction enzyme S subunit
LTEGTSFTRIFRSGQVLFGKRRAYQKKVSVPNFDGICSSDILVFEPSSDLLLPDFLPYIVQSDGFFEHALGTSAGSLSPRTKWQELAKYEFVLPPVEEQRRIGDLLAEMDTTLQAYRNLHTQSLIQSLIEEAIKKSGAIVSLAEVVKIVGGATPSTTRSEYWNGQIPWVTPSDLTKLETPVIQSSSRKITEQGLTNSSTKLLPTGAVLMSTRASIGFMAITQAEVCTNQGVTGLVCSDRILPKFLMYQLSGMQLELLKLSSGSTFPEIGRGKLAGLKVMLPSIDDQEFVVTAIESCEELLSAAKAAIAHIGMLRARVLNDMRGDWAA